MKTNKTHIVKLENVSVGYHQPILSSLNAEINKGEIVLMAGKNGSGKTTLLKSIFKEIPVLKGKIEINGKNLLRISSSEIGQQMAVVLSKSVISPLLKVFDLITLGRYPYKKWYQKLSVKELSDIEELMSFLNIDQYKNYYINELSDGNLQKTLIARALIQDCPLLILDEPTSFLDVFNKLEIMNLLNYLSKEKQKTILFTSHDLNMALSVADKIWFIKEGVMITGFTEDVACKENILDYFGGEAASFNYHSNEYDFRAQNIEKTITVQGDYPEIFWLKKALYRNGFTIGKSGGLSITAELGRFIVKREEREYYFDTILEVISFFK